LIAGEAACGLLPVMALPNQRPAGSQPDLVAFGQAFQRARQARGLSQRRLEQLSFVPQSTISRLENGKLPSVRAIQLARLVAVLGRVTIERADIGRDRSWTSWATIDPGQDEA
jgi:ribosome-binding protein aMBF1 (putative translation factor)